MKTYTSNIKLEHPSSIRVEGVAFDENQHFFPSHFLGLIVGKPGSGKTSLLKKFLQDPLLLFKRYDLVLILSPSPREYADLFLPEENFCTHLDICWAKEKLNNANSQHVYRNALVILDDLVVDIKTDERNNDLIKFIFNRRHTLENGMVSIFITTQRYITIPKLIRSVATFVTFFKVAPPDLKTISEETVHTNINFDQIAHFVFDKTGNFLMFNVQENYIFKNFNQIILFYFINFNFLK